MANRSIKQIEHQKKITELARITNTGKKRPSFGKEWRENISKSHKGKVSNMKDKNHSEESKNKMSESSKGKPKLWLRGKPKSEEHKRKLSIACRGLHSGESSHLWKGGITPINKKIRRSSEYSDWRTKVFKRDDFTCYGCDRRGVELHPHHMLAFAKYPEYRFEEWNGQTLCKECHMHLHNELGRS